MMLTVAPSIVSTCWRPSSVEKRSEGLSRTANRTVCSVFSRFSGGSRVDGAEAEIEKLGWKTDCF